MKAGIVVMIAGALTFAGCAAGAKDYSSAADLAKAASCSGYQKDSEPEMFVQEQGNCQIDGKDVVVYVFADNTARDNWVKVAKAAGASGYIGEGSKWVLTSDDKTAADKGSKQAGGNLK